MRCFLFIEAVQLLPGLRSRYLSLFYHNEVLETFTVLIVVTQTKPHVLIPM